MKKLFTILLILMAVACTAQESTIMDFATEGTPVDGDYLYLIKGGTTDRNVTKGVFQQNLQDTAAGHLIRIEALEAGGGGPSYGSSNQIPHMNTGGTDFDYDPSFLWTGTALEISGDVIIDAGDSFIFNGLGGNTTIREAVPGSIFFEAGGVNVFNTSATLFTVGIDAIMRTIIGPSSKSEDLGSPSVFWDDGYFDRLYIDVVGTHIDVSGTDMALTSAAAGTKTLRELDGQKEVSYTSCPANTTTNIIIGSTTTDVAFTMEFVAERNTEPDIQKITGEIRVLYDDVGSFAAYFSDFIPDYIDLGMSITANLSGSDIRLNIIVDNSNSNTLSFDYSITHKFYE